jgi:hypothetical protein
MEHKRVVRVERHTKAAEENVVNSSFYVSAKTGDSVDLMFRAVAADVLGVKLSKAERERNITVVKAQIPTDPTQGGRKPSLIPYHRQTQAAPSSSNHGEGERKSAGEETKNRTDSNRSSTNKNSAVCQIQ